MNANNRLEMFLALNAQAFKKGLSEAGSGLRNFSRSVSTVFTQVTAVVAPITALVSVTAGLTKLVGVTREFDKLSAGLVTATGSAKGAKESFDAIQDFAANTPYDLAQVTDSFVKLVNFGLNPSQRALTSYGNTSSALGKDLNQMIEAVADASTGEFERLKEFGIKASKEGDKVKFTFRGVTTEVGNNAREIEEHLIKLGETNFGDAMANRMSTLDGALSNLGDAWDKLFLNISQSGIGDAIADGVRVGIDALEELNAMIVSGELEGYLKAYSGKWSAWAEDIKTSINLVFKYFSGEMDGVETRGNSTVTFLIDAFRNFPENVRAFIGILTVEMASGFDRLKADATAFKDSVKAIFTSSTLDEVEAERLRQLEIIRQAKEESIDAIIKERDTAVKSADDQVAAVKKLREAYEKKREAEKADTTDKTAKFQVKPDDQKSTEQQQVKDFSDKSKAKFVEQDGQLVEVPGDEQQPSSPDDEKAKKEKADYQKQLAEKRKQLTPDEFKDRQEYWKDLEDKRPLTKDEEKQKKAEEAKFKKEEAERKRLENEKLKAARDAEKAEKKLLAERKKNGTESDGSEPSLLAKERSGQLAREKEERLARQREEEELQKKEAERKRKEKEETDTEISSDSASSGDTDGQWQKSLDNAKAYEKQMQQAHEAVAESSKKAAEEWAQAETQSAEKAKSAFQKYADKVSSLQDEISGREKSLAEELDGLDNRGTAESKWRRKAKEAKDYEKAAKAAMKAGDMEKALSLSDQAKAAYSSLKGGAGKISDKMGDQAALRGVKSSGMFGIDIAKAIQAATAKTALTNMPGGDIFGDLSSRIRGQLAAVAGGSQDKPAGKGAPPVSKVVELRFPGGSLQGNDDAAEAFLNLMAQAGINAG